MNNNTKKLKDFDLCRCPKCNSDYIESHGIEGTGDKNVYENIYCEDCRTSWRLTYALDNYEIYEEN